MLSQFLMYNNGNWLYCLHIAPLSWISFLFRSPQNIEQSSLFYTVDSHQLSILYVASIVNVCQSQSPSSCHPSSFPWTPIYLFSMSVYTSVLQIGLSIIFSQIKHTCINILVFLTSLCMTVSRSIDVSANGTFCSFYG